MPDVQAGFNIAKNEPADKRMVVANSSARRSLFWVYKGLKVYEEDSGLTYQCNVAAATNSAQPWTDNSDWEEWMPAKGATGATGSTWYWGGNDPNDNVGENGDFFLQTADVTESIGDTYQKAAGTWGSPIMNIKGAAGADASAGHHGGLSVQN